MRSLIRKLGVAVAFVGLMAAAQPASADLVTQWSYTNTVQFIIAGPDAPSFSGGGGQQTVNSSLIEWGCAGVSGQACQSRVGLVDTNPATPLADISGLVNTNGPFVPGISAFHDNNIIDGSFSFLTAASFTTSLDLTPLLPPGHPALPPGEGPPVLTFRVNFIETVNEEPCVATVTTGIPCPDIFVVANLTSLTQSFVFEGITYTVEVAAFGVGPLTDAECAAAGAPAGCIGFITQEGQTNPLNTTFRITAQVVPEPATLLLLGAGLLGLGGVAWSRRRLS